MPLWGGGEGGGVKTLSPLALREGGGQQHASLKGLKRGRIRIPGKLHRAAVEGKEEEEIPEEGE